MRNRLLYWTGTGFSSFGDGAQLLTIPWLILHITNDPFAIGVLIAINYVPGLVLAPWAGVFSDNRDAKNLAVLIDVIRTVIIGGMVGLTVVGVENVNFYYFLQGCLALCSTLFKPASQTMIRETFVEGEFVRVTSKASSINFTAAIVGGGFAGWLIAAFSPVWCFVLNMASFLVSALCYSFLRRMAQRKMTNKRVEFKKDIREGWEFVTRKQGMLYLFFLSMISSSSFQITGTILAPYALQDLNGSSVLFAALDITFSVGGALAGFVIYWALSRWKQYVVVGSMVGIGSTSILCGFSSSPVLAGISLFGLGFFTMFHFISMQTLLQINTPKELMGRVVSFRSMVVSFAKIFSALAAGYLSSLIPAHTVFWILSGLTTIALLTVTRTRDIPLPAEFIQRAS